VEIRQEGCDTKKIIQLETITEDDLPDSHGDIESLGPAEFPSLHAYLLQRDRNESLFWREVNNVMPVKDGAHLFRKRLEDMGASWQFVQCQLLELRAGGELWHQHNGIFFERSPKSLKVKNGSSVEREAMQGPFGACLPGTDRVWSAGPFPKHLRIHEPGMTWFSVACSHFLSLSALAFPCGYQVRAKLKDGFGTRRQRRMSSGKPLMTHVMHDRLYRTYADATGDACPVAPHFRRGHIRHLWKMAGVDRAGLPRDPFARVRLAVEKHVRRIYVHPSWIGDSRFGDDSFDFEIVTGETELACIPHCN